MRLAATCRRIAIILASVPLACASSSVREAPGNLLSAPRDPVLEAAEADARAIWRAVGIDAPRVKIVRSAGPTGSDGFCYCFGTVHPLIVVKFPGVNLIAHELGHAMGLHHVELNSSHEIMAPVVFPDSVIGPESLAEWRKAKTAD